MIITAGTMALLRCDGVFVRGGRGHLLFKRPGYSHGTHLNFPLRRMAAGSLWKDRLALPPFSFLLRRHQSQSTLLCFPSLAFTPTIPSVSCRFFFCCFCCLFVFFPFPFPWFGRLRLTKCCRRFLIYSFKIRGKQTPVNAHARRDRQHIIIAPA